MKTQKRQNYKCNKISVCQEVGGAQCGGEEMNRQSIGISGQYNVGFFFFFDAIMVERGTLDICPNP